MPNHYRLLGLAPFESNPSVIDHAADRVLIRGRVNGQIRAQTVTFTRTAQVKGDEPPSLRHGTQLRLPHLGAERKRVQRLRPAEVAGSIAHRIGLNWGPLPAHPADGDPRPQDEPRRPVPERAYKLGTNYLNLLKEERLACFDLIRFRVAIVRRPALDDVGDVDVGARQADGFDDLGEQLPGAADERLALHVFVGARRLADEHQVGRRVAGPEHDLRAAERVQLAAAAVGAQLAPDRRQRRLG